MFFVAAMASGMNFKTFLGFQGRPTKRSVGKVRLFYQFLKPFRHLWQITDLLFTKNLGNGMVANRVGLDPHTRQLHIEILLWKGIPRFLDYFFFKAPFRVAEVGDRADSHNIFMTLSL